MNDRVHSNESDDIWLMSSVSSISQIYESCDNSVHCFVVVDKVHTDDGFYYEAYAKCYNKVSSIGADYYCTVCNCLCGHCLTRYVMTL